RRDGQRIDAVEMALAVPFFTAAGDIPDAHTIVVPDRNHSPAVWQECGARCRLVVSGQILPPFARWQFPDGNRSVGMAAHERPSVVGKPQIADAAVVPAVEIGLDLDNRAPVRFADEYVAGAGGCRDRRSLER